MELETKKQIIIIVVLLSLFSGVFTYGFLALREDDKLLEENPVQSSAVIIRTYTAYKSRHFIVYEFVVNGKVYDAHESYLPHLEHVYIGDTCEIIYVESDPEISRALTDDNNLLKIKHRK